MPIRPEMRHLYPPPREWKAIRGRILARADDACECRGECGHDHDGGAHAMPTDESALRSGRCRAPHRATVRRYEYDRAPSRRARLHPWIDTWDEEHGDDMAASLEAVGVAVRGRVLVRVVLTISHRDHNPANNAPENLRALCQRCHLRYDRHEHARTRAARSK